MTMESSQKTHFSHKDIVQHLTIANIGEPEVASLAALTEHLSNDDRVSLVQEFISNINLTGNETIESNSRIRLLLSEYLASSLHLQCFDSFINARLHLTAELQKAGTELSQLISALSVLHSNAIKVAAHNSGQLSVDSWELALRRLFSVDVQLLAEMYAHNQSQYSLIDPLTSLMNERAFTLEFDRLISISGRMKIDTSLLYINIVNFKDINETYGNQEGDRVLAMLGNILFEQSRISDCVARLHDDRFAIILPDTSILNMQTVCTRMISAIEAKIDVPITVVIGGAEFQADRSRSLEDVSYSATELMERARLRSLVSDRHEFCFDVEPESNNVLFLVK